MTEEPPWNGQWKVFHWGLKSIVRGHNPRPYFYRAEQTTKEQRESATPGPQPQNGQ